MPVENGTILGPAARFEKAVGLNEPDQEPETGAIFAAVNCAVFALQL